MATLTDSLSNGLKSLFSGLGAKTTNTTNGGVPLLNTSTGEPNGMMNMAMLSKLLAGWKYQDFINNNTLPGGTFASMKGANMNGLWGFSSTNLVPSDAPSGFQNGAIFHVDLYADISLQICIEKNLGLKTRFYWYGTWHAWA